jgi:hypothetical protein
MSLPVSLLPADGPPALVAQPAINHAPFHTLPPKSARYKDVPCSITTAEFGNDDLAETFGIDTAKIETWDSTLKLEKIVEGPPEIMGMWTVISVVMAFLPEKYDSYDSAKRSIKNKAKKFPNLKMVEIKNENVSSVNFCTVDFTGTIISTIKSFSTFRPLWLKGTNSLLNHFLVLISLY